MAATVPANVAAAVERIRAVLGPAGCLDAPADIEPFLVDFRGLYRGATPLVACPAATADVAAVLAICHELGVGVVPHGGNTIYCGGATPHERGDEIVLSLRRMNRVREVDADNFSITVEAGCLLTDVQAAADSADRFFPLALGSEGSCQVGGNLSTNAGGLNALRYGAVKDVAEAAKEDQHAAEPLVERNDAGSSRSDEKPCYREEVGMEPDRLSKGSKGLIEKVPETGSEQLLPLPVPGDELFNHVPGRLIRELPEGMLHKVG